MTYKEISNMIASMGVPYAYHQFPEGTEQATPFICFYFTYNNDLAAENSNYQKIERLVIEVYTDNKNFTLEHTVESILNANGLVFTKNEEFIDSERMLEEIYETDVIITEET